MADGRGGRAWRGAHKMENPGRPLPSPRIGCGRRALSVLVARLADAIRISEEIRKKFRSTTGREGTKP